MTTATTLFGRRGARRSRLLGVALALAAPAAGLAGVLAGSSVASAATTFAQTFSFNDTTQYFTVPSGVNMITLLASGGSGGGAVTNLGEGASLSEMVPVNPGDTLVVMIGGAGSAPSGNYGAGGAGGLSSGDGMNGGAGGSTTAIDGTPGSGGGGGTEVVDATTNTVLVVAAGGGGSGGNAQFSGSGGGGGDASYTGLATLSGQDGSSPYGDGGAGGPFGASGAAAGNDGSSPASLTISGGGGGGGGGYLDAANADFGGGDAGAGGGWNNTYQSGGGGGGGGTSYTPADATNVQWGASTGDGQVSIGYPSQSSTSLSFSADPIAPGSSYNLNVTVNAGDGYTPTGTITIFENGAAVGSAPLENEGDTSTSTASFATTAPSTPGTVQWQVSYGGAVGEDGDPGLAPSTSAIEDETVAVPLATTTTAVQLTPANVKAGTAYKVQATVTASNGDTPTGTVEFMANGIDVGSASLDGAKPDVATFDATAPKTAGTISWSASYEGDANNDASQSGTASETVTAKPVLSSSSPSTGTAGTTVTLVGRNLTGVTKVLFGTKAASSFTCTATACTAVAPNGGDGTVKLFVLTSAGKSSFAKKAVFTYES
jgi:hypothetical protein